VHAPGFYLHLEPDECFVGVGIWRPDGPTLGKIRSAISENGKKWIKVSQEKMFKQEFELTGLSLTNPPRGYSREHPLIDDLKRKDYIAISRLNNKRIVTAGFTDDVVKSFNVAVPYMKFLCKALDLQI